MTNYTPEQIKEMREAFNVFDRDRSGKISANELKSVFKSMHLVASDTEIKKVMKEMDVNHDGEISFDEFLQVMGSQYYKKYSLSEIRIAFEEIDKDKSGYITVDELEIAMKSLGNSYTPDELKNIMKSVDLDGNGSISFDEFSLMLSH